MIKLWSTRISTFSKDLAVLCPDILLSLFIIRLVSVGKLEAAVSLLLSAPPESSYFYANAYMLLTLFGYSSHTSSLLAILVQVVAANMVRTDNSLSGTHLLCAVGRYQEACSHFSGTMPPFAHLQDAGCWTDAATLADSHLKGFDYTSVWSAFPNLDKDKNQMLSRLVPDRDLHEKIIEEVTTWEVGTGLFGLAVAKKQRGSKAPGLTKVVKDIWIGNLGCIQALATICLWKSVSEAEASPVVVDASLYSSRPPALSMHLRA
nr:WD repeat-containing protein 11-like [Ipomoea batatas]